MKNFVWTVVCVMLFAAGALAEPLYRSKPDANVFLTEAQRDLADVKTRLAVLDQKILTLQGRTNKGRYTVRDYACAPTTGPGCYEAFADLIAATGKPF